MVSNVKLGKITNVSFGYGGYQNSQFGLTVELNFDGCGSVDFISGGWGEKVQVDKYTKWTEKDRQIQRANMVKEIDKLLNDAKVQNIDQLTNKPIAVTTDGFSMKSWRILTEVL